MIDIFENAHAIQIFHGRGNKNLIVPFRDNKPFTACIAIYKNQKGANAVIDECVAACDMQQRKEEASALQVLREAVNLQEDEWVAAVKNADGIYEIVERGVQSFGEITIVTMRKNSKGVISVTNFITDKRLYEEGKEAFEEAKQRGHFQVEDDKLEEFFYEEFSKMGYKGEAIKALLAMNNRIANAKRGTEEIVIVSDGEKYIRPFTEKTKRVKKMNQIWNGSRIILNPAA